MLYTLLFSLSLAGEQLALQRLTLGLDDESNDFELTSFCSHTALACATPQQEVTAIGSTLTSALKTPPLLVKRDDQADAINGLSTLMSEAINAVSTGGMCSTECEPWVTDMQVSVGELAREGAREGRENGRADSGAALRGASPAPTPARTLKSDAAPVEPCLLVIWEPAARASALATRFRMSGLLSRLARSDLTRILSCRNTSEQSLRTSVRTPSRVLE